MHTLQHIHTCASQVPPAEPSVASCTCPHIHTHTYIHTHAHASTHTHTHTHTAHGRYVRLNRTRLKGQEGDEEAATGLSVLYEVRGGKCVCVYAGGLWRPAPFHLLTLHIQTHTRTHTLKPTTTRAPSGAWKTSATAHTHSLSLADCDTHLNTHTLTH